MKKNIYVIVSLAIALLLGAGCSQEQLGVTATSTGDDSREIHFLQSSLSKEFEQGLTEGTIAVTLGRSGNVGTYRVLLEKSGKDAALFSIRDTVVIPDGQYTVDVPLKVDLSSVILGSSVDVSLSIVGRDATLGEDSAYIGQYSDFLTVSASFALEWEPYMRTTETGEKVQQTATYHFSQFYTGWQSGIPVEVAKGTDNIFRLVDWASGAYFNFRVNWSKKTVSVPGQSIGYYDDSSASYVYVADLAQYLGDDSYYSSFPCTWDGDRTFTMTLIYYIPDGGYYGYGEESIVFAGDHDTDPVIESATYEGAGKFRFELGDYVSYCKALVAEGDISKDSAKISSLVSGICLGTAEGVETFSSDTLSVTAAAKGANTLVVVPFDSEGVPGEETVLRFTYDPDGTLLPQVLECALSLPEDDPYTSAEWRLKVKNVTRVEYVMGYTEMLNSYKERYTMDKIFSALGHTLEDAYVTAANTEAGVKLTYTTDEGKDYTMLLRLYNALGDVLETSASICTKSHSETYLAKSIDDFTGSYLLSATVDDSEGNSTSEAFRVDIIKTGENTVSLKGLSNYKNYCPEVTGTYIPEEHCIRLYSQNLGTFSYMTVVFGFVSDLYSGIWGQTSALELGFSSDGYVRFRPMEGSEFPVNGYKFLLFDGSSYSGYAAGDKTYTDLLMMKL